MALEGVLLALRDLESAGVIQRFAIGGAVGATFYLEPAATVDVDIFVALDDQKPGTILSLNSIYSYLAARGATAQGEYLLIAGWPVQFLPASGALLEEAIREAVELDVEGVGTRVFRAEHLAAVALDTGRAKDKARVLQFVESDVLDRSQFETILARHGLLPKWVRFKTQFL